MDDIVLKAMAKWPNVPDCYGWLGLDRRGDWYMRDDRVQQTGAFQSGCTCGSQPGSKGTRLQHEKLCAFIARNYAKDERGCYYFQNGPQRVYVELDLTPHVARLDESGCVTLETGDRFQVTVAISDEHGHLYVETPDASLALVHTQDMVLAAELLEAEALHLRYKTQANLPAAYGYVVSPEAQKATGT